METSVSDNIQPAPLDLKPPERERASTQPRASIRRPESPLSH